jgi:hypothetical protein
MQIRDHNKHKVRFRPQSKDIYHVHLQVGPTDFGTAKDLYYYDADSNTDRKYSAAVAKEREVTVLTFHEAPLLRCCCC